MDQKDSSDIKLNYVFDRCYICHRPLNKKEAHSTMCPSCNQFNSQKRESFLKRDNTLNGVIAIVTGGRIKIGYETSLSLLRKGATVLITTRFPVDAAQRYSKENDFSIWSNHLMIYGIDFRDIREVEKLINWINIKLPHLDILINNAAQTIARPEEYYQHLKMLEKREFHFLSKKEQALLQNITKAKQIQKKFLGILSPLINIDENGFQIDFRSQNSWTSKAWEISTKELLEVQLVNVTAPFLFCSRLVNIMKKSSFDKRFIINVSSMEGRFSKRNKNSFHPHTNMAKASLNMLTRTIAESYYRLGIYVNSVDTGWVTDENPYPIYKKNKELGFRPPLDAIDGAARVCDPFLSYFDSKNKKELEYGKFLKDFHCINW